MAQLKVMHGSWTYKGSRYGVGIHDVTGDVATAAQTFATANPTIAAYTGTTFSGAAATVYSAEIYKLRTLQPELGDILTKQQANQAAYESARQTKGRTDDLEWIPLAETSGDFDAIDHDDPAITGTRFRQGDLPADPGDAQLLTPPPQTQLSSDDVNDVQQNLRRATVDEAVFQPTGTEPSAGPTAAAVGEDKEKAQKAAEKQEKKASKEAEKAAEKSAQKKGQAH